MKRKGFFSFQKRTLSLIIIAVTFAIFMFIPTIYYSVTKGGTSYQFVCANIILCIVPLFSLADGYFRAKNKE